MKLIKKTIIQTYIKLNLLNNSKQQWKKMNKHLKSKRLKS